MGYIIKEIEIVGTRKIKNVLAMFDSSSFKNYIMDVRLPDILGTEAAKILRQNQETADIPIVFVTALVMAENIEETKNITNSGFIGKSINPRTFAKEISQFIRKDN